MGSMGRAVLWGALAALVAFACSTNVTLSGGTGGAGAGGHGGCNCPAGQVCLADLHDPGHCVDCSPGPGACPDGQYCLNDKFSCAPGCDQYSACPSPTKCDLATHQCLACLGDGDCPDGTCVAGKCVVSACVASLDCGNANLCCAGACVPHLSDPANCGACGKKCAGAPHLAASCQNGACVLGACEAGFVDCDLDASNGCEWDLAAKGPCACTPGEKHACYGGAPGTLGVGTCKAGSAVCTKSGDGWGPCVGQVVPMADLCFNGLDEDCSGKADDPPDIDGDGWNVCQGDCCETTNVCSDPKRVNPGAYEFPGNGVDDDCDGNVDDPAPPCDGALGSSSANALDYAKAMDLCQLTSESPPPSKASWGVISASFSLADGSGAPNAGARSIRGGYGSGVKPFTGKSLAVLATGFAAAHTAPNATNPDWKVFQPGSQMGTSSAAPGDWLAANNGAFPNATGCPDAPDAQAHDPVQLKLRVRVPTNARSFSFATLFYSAEYPEYVCSQFNDFFVTLLDSAFKPGPGQKPNPSDKNLAVYVDPKKNVYPLGVNLAYGDTGLFTECVNGPTGCADPSFGQGTYNGCKSTALLAGTGFDLLGSADMGGLGGCDPSNLTGGGTGWLAVRGNVKPGETIELRLAIWDVGDDVYDSLVLLDDFRWSGDPAQPGVGKRSP